MAQAPVQPQVEAGRGGGAAGKFNSTSLYVGDLEGNVVDSQLYDLFSQLGTVVSVRVCRDISTRRSLGYAYVNYANPADAARALEVLNYTPLNGKPIRIMYSNRDPSTRKSGTANIFIKNLDKPIDNKALRETFAVFGEILSCKIATDASGQSKGYGFVQFDQEEAAQSAIEKLNGMLVNGKQVFVGPFLRKQDRENAANKTKFTNVFVKNLSETTTEHDLHRIFGEFGTITSAVVMRDGGKSKCFGFVNFEKADDAARSVASLNGKKIEEKVWYVGKAQKKSEREQELKERFKQCNKESGNNHQGANLYLKNIDDSIDDDKLRGWFSEFGTITSCKVMRDPSGVSKGSGFVAFTTAVEAARALAEMNGKMVAGKPLYVALAQRKEDRKASLQVQFSQMHSVGMTSFGPHMPMYPPSRHGLGQQISNGRAPPAFINSQQQLVSQMRPSGAATPNFIPMVQQGMRGQRLGSRHSGIGSMQRGQHQMPMLQHQMYPRGRPYRYQPGRNASDAPVSGRLRGQCDTGGLPMREASTPPAVPVGALASALANATPEQQRTMLGESLYALVELLEHDMASKVTGMLLEMDQTEVLHLLESPEALKAKVSEAIEVLRTVSPQPGAPTGQLAALSLNDGIVT